MKFTMTTIVTATLAAVASSAAIQLERRAETLPARYGLEIASPIPELNGVRLRFLNERLQINLGPEAVFRGGADRVILDPDVHSDQEPGMEWLHWSNTPMAVGFVSAHAQQEMAECGQVGYQAGGFTQSKGILKHIGTDGSSLDSFWATCGRKAGAFFWWDILAYWSTYGGCDKIEFRIVEL